MNTIRAFLSLLLLILTAKADVRGNWINNYPNVLAFKIDSHNEINEQGKIFHEIRARLIRNIKGQRQDTLYVKVPNDNDEDADLISKSWLGKRRSLWCNSRIAEGVTVIVAHEETDLLLAIGSEYLDDFDFLASVPKDVSLAERRLKVDQFLRNNDGVIHEYVAAYIADMIASFQYSNDVWNAYVKGNPLRISDSALGWFLSDLGAMVDELYNEKDPSARGERVDRWIGEFATQIDNASFSDVQTRHNCIAKFARYYNGIKTLASNSVRSIVEELVGSDKLSPHEKALFR